VRNACVRAQVLCDLGVTVRGVVNLEERVKAKELLCEAGCSLAALTAATLGR